MTSASVTMSGGRLLARQSVKGDVAKRSLLLPMILLFVALVLQLTVRVQILNVGYQLERFRDEALRNDAALRALRVKQAADLAPASLQRSAAERLGMKPLAPQFVRRVQIGGKENKKVGR